MKNREQSNFGLGISDCKKRKSLEDCPFSEDNGDRELFKREQWIAGWEACENTTYGNIKQYELYEDDPSIDDEDE